MDELGGARVLGRCPRLLCRKAVGLPPMLRHANRIAERADAQSGGCVAGGVGDAGVGESAAAEETRIASATSSTLAVRIVTAGR